MLSWMGGGRSVPRFLSAVFLMPMLAVAAIAQEAYSHRLWQAADGLPTDVVQAFAETPDNALWIGTTDGLVRFDGSHFRYYQRENTPALGADSVFCLTVTRDGTLWIGIEGGGLVRYRDGHFREFTALDGLSDNVVRAIFEDRDGVLWIGTDQGLFQLRGERLVRVDGTDLIPELSVACHLPGPGRSNLGGEAPRSCESSQARRKSMVFPTVRRAKGSRVSSKRQMGRYGSARSQDFIMSQGIALYPFARFGRR